ncbi:MAG: hypothetical protein ACPLTR_01950 [Thermacetogeniaceae bacterium]
MAELVGYPTCGRWNNLELREAVCDKEGSLVCQRCNTVLEQGIGVIKSTEELIEQLREKGYNLNIDVLAKGEDERHSYTVEIYDACEWHKAWYGFGATLREGLNDAIKNLSEAMKKELQELEEDYKDAVKLYKDCLARWRKVEGTPAEDIAWQESRRAYWDMRQVIRRLYEARDRCQV